MTRKNDGTTRRGFLERLGIAAALPLFPALAPQVALASGGFPDALATLREGLRAAYVAELARFAETLRPRFEAGELHAYRENDDATRLRAIRAGERSDFYEAPQFEVERLAEAHFGLAVTERPTDDGGSWLLGDGARGHMILAVSPHADVTGENASHPCDHAKEAVGWDVIALARARGWYTATADEQADPLEEAEAPT